MGLHGLKLAAPTGSPLLSLGTVVCGITAQAQTLVVVTFEYGS